MVAPVLYLFAVSLTGYGLTTFSGNKYRAEERLALGIVSGAIAVSGCGLLLFELLGMGLKTSIGAVLLPATAGTFAVTRRRRELSLEIQQFRIRLCLPFRDHRSSKPLVLLSVITTAIATRILALSYQYSEQSVSAGSLAVWGDWSAHLAYAGSFAFGDNRGFKLPIASGVPFRYHFLADFFSALFTPLGATLPQALAVSSLLFAVAFPILLWSVTLRLSNSRLAACFAVPLFTLNGGFGWFWLIGDVQKLGWQALVNLPRTYARVPDAGILVDNAISASLYAQRSTQLGLCLALSCLLIVLVGRVHGDLQPFWFAGLLLGSAGVIHAHTLLTGLLLGSLAWTVERKRQWFCLILPGAIIGLPLAWLVLPPKSSLRIEPGWIANNFSQPWLWFWIRNLGLFCPILILVSVFGGVPNRIRKLQLPLWLWFLIPNIFSFHPSSWNNTKYFVFWQLGGAITLSIWIARFFGRSAHARIVYKLRGFGVGVIFLSLIASGILDTIRSLNRNAAIPIAGRDAFVLADWLRENTPKSTVIVQAPSNTAVFAALSGKPTLSGYPGWTWDLSLPDWRDREEASKAILAGNPTALMLVKKYDVGVVVIGPEERDSFGASDSYWKTHGVLIAEQGKYRAYRTRSGHSG